MSDVKPYGCHNRQPKDGHWVQDGTYVDEHSHQVVIMEWHTDRSTPDCQYRKSTPDDQRCIGCRAP